MTESDGIRMRGSLGVTGVAGRECIKMVWEKRKDNCELESRI